MNIIRITLFFFYISFSFSQNSSGEVFYDLKMNKKVDSISKSKNNGNLEFAFLSLKNLFEKKYILKFNDSISIQKERNEINYNFSYDELYINNKSSKFVNKIDFYGKTFLIKDTLTPLVWSIIESETKQINGYLCRKAKAIINEINIIAWYAELIPVSSGPDFYFGLPGLILELETDSLIYSSSNIRIYNLDITTPNNGSVVSNSEFERIKTAKEIEIKFK